MRSFVLIVISLASRLSNLNYTHVELAEAVLTEPQLGAPAFTVDLKLLNP